MNVIFFARRGTLSEILYFFTAGMKVSRKDKPGRKQGVEVEPTKKDKHEKELISSGPYAYRGSYARRNYYSPAL
jgi:hypothetical protein